MFGWFKKEKEPIREPEIGDEYVIDNKNPFSDTVVKIIDKKLGYVKYTYKTKYGYLDDAGSLLSSSKKIEDFLRLYQLIEEKDEQKN